MTQFELQQLKSLCDNPRDLIRCFGEWHHNNFSEESKQHILTAYFRKYKLLSRIKSMDLEKDRDNKMLIRFQLKNDPNEYALFGILGEDNEPGIVLAQRRPDYLNN